MCVHMWLVWAVMFMTSKQNYHYKGHEPYKQLLHIAYAQFDTVMILVAGFLPSCSLNNGKGELVEKVDRVVV